MLKKIKGGNGVERGDEYGKPFKTVSWPTFEKQSYLPMESTKQKVPMH